MAKSKKGEAVDHQQENPNDPVLIPDLSKIAKLAEKMAKESLSSDRLEWKDLRETICGTTDDSQPVEQYDGSLGVSQSFVSNNESPVGVLRWHSNLASIYDNPGNVASQRWCTGTMISSNLFLTAGHCFDQTGGGWQRPRVNGSANIISPEEIATRMNVEFNYQVNGSGVLQTPTSVAVEELIEYRLDGLDFAIVRLAGAPGTQFGTTGLAPDDGNVGDMLCIIGHPAGQPKRIEAGPLTSFDDFRIRYNDIDTLGGNSGSGILRESDGCIVGIHTNGGCNVSMTGSNFGLRITRLRAASPTVQGLGTHTNTIRDTLTTNAIGDVVQTNATSDVFTNPTQDRGTAIISDRPTNPIRDIITTPVQDRPTTIIADRPPTNVVFDNPPTNIISDRPPTNIVTDRPPTNVILDNATNVFTDRGQTSVILDRGPTNIVADQPGSNKALDDVKTSGLDKQFSDRIDPGRLGGLVNPRRFGGERPFVLATPHHAQGDMSGLQQEQEAYLEAYAEALAELEAAIEATAAELEALQEQYATLMAEIEGSEGY
ncbi:MAG: serine protease [Pseudomonadota bacterium]